MKYHSEALFDLKLKRNDAIEKVLLREHRLAGWAVSVRKRGRRLGEEQSIVRVKIKEASAVVGMQSDADASQTYQIRWSGRKILGGSLSQARSHL